MTKDRHQNLLKAQDRQQDRGQTQAHVQRDSISSVEPYIINAPLSGRIGRHSHERLTLVRHKPHDFWEISPEGVEKNLVIKPTKSKGMGLFSKMKIPSGKVVFQETGVFGTNTDIDFAAVLLSTDVKLSYNERVLHDLLSLKSPFENVKDLDYQKATAMARSNYFDIGRDKRVLFQFASRINHSCNPNMVRTHSSSSQNKHTITLTSTREIKAGDELLIRYSPEAGHKDCSFFTCDCNLNADIRNASVVDDQIDRGDEEYIPRAKKGARPRSWKPKHGAMCTDVEQNEEVPVSEWLEKEDGIVIRTDKGRQYCIGRSNVARSDPEYLRCIKNYNPNNEDVVHVAKSPVYVKLRLEERPTLVRKSDVMQVVKSKKRAFVLKPDGKDGRSRKSANTFRVSERNQQDRLGSSYCQEGSEVTLHVLKPDTQ